MITINSEFKIHNSQFTIMITSIRLTLNKQLVNSLTRQLVYSLNP